MLTSRPNTRPAKPAADSWQRMERWFAEHIPGLLRSLRPGASTTDIRSFEERAGVQLPEEVRESYRVHDGAVEFLGPILGEPYNPLEEVLRSLLGWRQLDERERNSDVDSGLGDDATSFPPDAIRCQYTDPGWIPIGNWDGNCIGVDLDPAANGVRGQVINFGRDEERKFVLAVSWAQLLEDIADELESGSFVAAHPAWGEEGDSFFRRREHDDQAFYSFYREWSEAKLPASFRAVAAIKRLPAPLGPVVAGPDADAAATVVAKFVAAMHAYELHWLAERPIHEHGYRYLCESASGFSSWGLPEKPDRTPVEQLLSAERRSRAAEEWRQIVSRFCTPRPRAMAGAFVQRYPVGYDPERDRIADIRSAGPDQLIVSLQPTEGRVVRFHMTRAADGWRIDRKDRTTDHIRFERVSV